MVSDEEANLIEAETVSRKRKATEAIDSESVIISSNSPIHKKLCVAGDS